MKILGILSGKGGVGKTTVAVNLSRALAKTKKVGIFDADISGSNIITALGKIDKNFTVDKNKVIPAKVDDIEVFAISMYKKNESIPAPILRDGVWKTSYIIDTFHSLKYEAEYLLIDFPPGVTDELIALLLEAKNIKTLIVTTGNKKSVENARDTIKMLEMLKIPILGVVENMGYMEHKTQEKSEKIPLFNDVDVKKELKYKILAEIPFKRDIGPEDFTELQKIVEKNL